MPERSLAIAATRSSRSLTMTSSFSWTSVASCFGHQVDPAQPLALGLQPLDLLLGRLLLGQRLLRLDPGRSRRLLGLDLQRLDDLPLDLMPLRDRGP